MPGASWESGDESSGWGIAGQSKESIPRGTLNKAGWRAVTVGSVLVTLSLAAALLAQDGLFSADPGLPEHPDGLTTLALVLAILAFLVQILIYVFQTNAARASVQRSEELNADTRMALGKIQADSAATQKVLFAQFDRLLDYVVGAPDEQSEDAETTALDEVLDGEGDEDGADADHGPVTAAEVQRIVHEAVRSRDRPSFAAGALKGPPSKEDLRAVQYLQAWPSRKEVDSAVEELKGLSPLALAVLTRFATTEIRQRLEGKRVGLVRGKAEPEATQGLIEAGLVRVDGNRVVLTDRGRDLARALPIGKGHVDRPDWYDEAVRPLLAAPG
jgi:hypothetical protein